MKKMILLTVSILLVVSTGASLATGVKKRRPLPPEYGRTVIDNFSDRTQGTVTFDHWLHRARFTCRVCHVDIGFGMQAGSTGITARDNMEGYYCGTCHNGQMKVEGRKVFESCNAEASPKSKASCMRCHSTGEQKISAYDFRTFTRDFPRERFGNGVDWEKAEAEGKISPVDYIEGVSIERPALSAQKDFGIKADAGMPGIIFSHAKHTVWNGCELCHPDIFIGVKRGATSYGMVDIYDGKYCGACHRSVAFPLLDCQRCHLQQVQ